MRQIKPLDCEAKPQDVYTYKKCIYIIELQLRRNQWLFFQEYEEKD